jgi:hypothetical protein
VFLFHRFDRSTESSIEVHHLFAEGQPGESVAGYSSGSVNFGTLFCCEPVVNPASQFDASLSRKSSVPMVERRRTAFGRYGEICIRVDFGT